MSFPRLAVGAGRTGGCRACHAHDVNHMADVNFADGFGPSPAPAAEAESLAFTQRYRALQHGGIVRAANSSITCRRPVERSAVSCPAAREGRAAANDDNDDFEMFYIDVDNDPNTYNSSRAEVRPPAGARVSYARLYWGGNLRVGEQKPPKDNGRVLIAEPGGQYKEVLADTVVGHRVAHGADAFQASADVTPWCAPAARAPTPWRRSTWRWATRRPGLGAAGR